MYLLYSALLAAGLFGTLTPRVTLQLEERRIDIDASHGNLPKAGLAIRATPRFLVSASYAHSAGGNLGARLASVRLDFSRNSLSTTAGFVWGPAAPAVLDLLGQSVAPGASLTEGYIGIGKTVGRTAWLVIGDYQNVAGARRATLTLNCNVTLRTYQPLP